jgi:3',5'-cyclic AMP phosphodiesterase CpdA
MTSNGIKIVHLSDLHIGMKGASDIWKNLSKHLIQKVKPELVLITGDIADSPEQFLFKEAAEFFDALKTSGIECLVCPGNHDRHVQGIAVDTESKGLNLFGKWSINRIKEQQPREQKSPPTSEDDTSASLFDQIFVNLGMLSPSIDKYFPNRTADFHWKIRVVTLDSSIESKILAQGHVSLTKLANFRSAAQYNGEIEDAPHLVIALIHHHLLPITALEAGNQALGDIKKATTVLNNAGSVLKALAEVGTDLVLHGHEHCHHLARFGLVGARNDEILIVGAGSATGAKTGEGCDAIRSSFNIFHLQKDRSVWFERMKYSNSGTWDSDGEICELLSGKQTRQSRYMRHNASDKTLPRSQQERHFIYTFSRDARICETRTNWPIESNKFSIKTGNCSGKPFFRGGVVELIPGQSIELEPCDDMQSEQLRFQYTTRLPWHDVSVYNHSAHEIIWLAGGVLTKADLLRCDKKTMDKLRIQGKEFVATFVEHSLKSLWMSVELPEEYAPKEISDFEVLTGKKSDSIQWEINTELTKRLRLIGKARIRLDIPYPLPDYYYAIAWNLPDIPDISSSSDIIKKREKLKQNSQLANRIIHDIEEAIKSLLPNTLVSIALYCPTIKNSHLVFERFAYTILPISPNPSKIIEPKYNGHPFCRAYWGIPGCIDKDHLEKVEAGLHEDEQALFAIPLKQGRATESLAIVRIGWLSELYEKQAFDSFNLIDATVQAGSACALLELIGE